MNGTGTTLKKASRTKAILRASMQCTMPMENSWKTRDKIGGAMSTTPLREPSTTSLWTYCSATWFRDEVPSRKSKLSGSSPMRSKCGKLSRSRPDISQSE